MAGERIQGRPKRTLQENKAYFFSKIKRVNGCWLWQGGKTSNGYGQILGMGVHRWSYSMFNGNLMPNLVIDHLCSTRGCVNPDHLQQTTQRNNTLRSGKGAASINYKKTACLRGHVFDLANTRIEKKDGARTCRVCKRDDERARRRKAKQNV